MRFCRAKRGDVSEISKCRKESILNVNWKSYSDFALKEFLEESNEENVSEDIKSIDVYCLKRWGKIVGTVSFYENKIDGLYVNPKYTGRGYGKKMLRFVEKKMRKKYEYSTLFSTLNSEGFYKKNGYDSGEIVVSFSKNPLAFVEMKKKIVPN